MNMHADKTSENKSQAIAESSSKEQSNGEATFQFVDNRQEMITQKKLQTATNNSPGVQQLKVYQEMANNSTQVKQLRSYQAIADNFTLQTTHPKENIEQETLQGKIEPIQKKANNTGLPDNLKSGIEKLSGYSADDVKVHYNSNKPAQLQAHAYAQGTDIHIASGQEKHLPHEAWHVVQQKQGRVKPTKQMKGKVNINDDSGLEKEADVMGAKALQMKTETKSQVEDKTQLGSNPVFQLARAVGTHTALADGNVRDVAWDSIAVFNMDDDLIIANGNEAEWHGVNHVWGSIPLGVNGWINESKVSEGAPDMANVLWSRALKGAATYADVLTNLGYPGNWIAATAEPWFVMGDSNEDNTKAYARVVMNGQASTPGDFTVDRNVDAELIPILDANPFIQGMLISEVDRVGTPGQAPVIGGVVNPSNMLRRAAVRFDNIVTTPVPQIAAETVTKVDPVSYMDYGHTITQGTGATEGILLHEMGHHLENNLDPADFATLHNFMRARAVDDGTGAPRMKGVGYKRLGGTESSNQGYDMTPINYNVKNMAGIGMKKHLVGLGLQKGPLGFTDNRRSAAKREIEDSMLSWGNSNNVSYHSQTNTDNYATEFLSTSLEFFAKGTTVRRMIDADPLRVALLLYLARRADYILVRDALQAVYHLPAPMPGTNYMLDNLIHKVSLI